jgi:hypothetical protein
MNTRKPGTSTVDGPNFADLLIREFSEDSVQGQGHARTCREARATSEIYGRLSSGISGEDIHESRKKQSQNCSPRKSGFKV